MHVADGTESSSMQRLPFRSDLGYEVTYSKPLSVGAAAAASTEGLTPHLWLILAT